MRCWLRMSSSPSAVSLAVRGGLLLAMSAGLASAESEGTIFGRVSDPSGRAVPKALIILRNSATLVDRTASTNDEGFFELAALSVGSYRLHVRALGFRLYIAEVITVEVA